MATLLDQQLAEVKRQWEAASGDPARQAQLHQQANYLRAQGANELVANQILFGADEGLRRTQEFSSNYIPGYTVPNYTTQTSGPAQPPTPIYPQQSQSANFEKMLQDALAQQSASYQNTINQLSQLIAAMQPPAPPRISMDEAMQSAMGALSPLLEQAREQISRDADSYRAALQSQIAQSGVYGDAANRALANAERVRQEALRNLSAQAQAQAANQALQLLGLEQGRYSSQQAANADAARIAALFGQTAIEQENQRIQNLMRLLGLQAQTGLAAAELDQQRQLAMLPYTNVRPEFLLDLLRLLREQGSGMALR